MEYVGPYRIIEEIARGGMGVVFRAEAPDGRLVAVKLLLAVEPTGRQVQRFQTELEALRRLQHPHVVPVLDAGEQQGHPYLVLELIEGDSLQHRLDRGAAFRPEAAAEIVYKLALALGAAHKVSILHRDVKPANVLLDRSGEPRLTDFGLAKDLSSDSKLSRTGTFLGSPGYWPPEQAAGDLKRIGPHSDVYGLGATLYALLTRRPPLEAGTLADTVRSAKEDKPSPPSADNGEVDAALDAICLKCLEKDPLARYRSANGLARDLERYLAGLPPLALEAKRRSTRGPLLAAALILVGGAGAAAFLVGQGAGSNTGSVVESPAGSDSPVATPIATPATSPLTRERALELARGFHEEGSSHLAASELEAAIASFGRATELDPQHALSWVSLADALLRGDRLPESLTAARRAVSLEPDAFASRRVLASSLIGLNQFEEALPQVERARVLDPAHLPTVVQLIHVYRLLGRRDEAVKALFVGLRLDARFPPLVTERAWLALSGGMVDKAKRYFDEVLEQDPECAQALAGLGRLRLGQKRFQQAKDLLQRSVELAARSGETHFDLGVANNGLGDLRGAYESYSRAIEANPRHVGAYINRANLRERFGGAQGEVMADLTKALDVQPRHPVARHNRGSEFLERGDLERAEADLRVAVEVKPDYAKAHFRLATVLRKRGQPEQALRHVEIALEGEPTWIDAVLERGLIREQLGDLDGARKDVQHFADLYKHVADPTQLGGDLEAMRQAMARLGLKPSE